MPCWSAGPPGRSTFRSPLSPRWYGRCWNISIPCSDSGKIPALPPHILYHNHCPARLQWADSCQSVVFVYYLFISLILAGAPPVLRRKNGIKPSFLHKKKHRQRRRPFNKSLQITVAIFSVLHSFPGSGWDLSTVMSHHSRRPSATPVSSRPLSSQSGKCSRPARCRPSSRPIRSSRKFTPTADRTAAHSGRPSKP